MKRPVVVLCMYAVPFCPANPIAERSFPAMAITFDFEFAYISSSPTVVTLMLKGEVPECSGVSSSRYLNLASSVE
jgi:hypothetical protein